MLGYQKEELLGKVGSDILLTPADKEKILQKNLERQFGKSEQYTIEMIKKSGEKILLLLNATPVFSNGIVSGSFATCLDITDSKRTEEQLLTSEARYRSITENVFDMIALVDLQGKYLFCNKSFYDILGYSVEETIGRICFDLVVPEERKTLQEVYHQSLASGIHEAHVTVKVICKNGAVKLLDQKARLLVDEEKTPDKVLLIAQDITEKTQSENIFRARNTVLEFAPQHSLFEVLQKTLDEAELLTNSKIGFYHFLLEDQETLSMQAWSTNTIANMCNAKGRGMHSKVSAAGVWAECAITRLPVIHNSYSALTNKKGMPEGHTVVIRELVVPVFRENKIVALLGVGNKLTEYNEDDVKLLSQFADTTWDIAENKMAEDSLRKSETRYRDISRLSTDFAYSCIHTGERYVVDWISDAFYSITGFSENDLQRNKCWLFTAHDEDRQKITEILVNLKIGDTSEDEFRLVDKNGSIHYIVNKMECASEPAGATGKRVFGAVQDITSRKIAEDALRESKEKYRRLSEATFEAIFITEQGVCVEQNLTAEKMFGYSSEAALGRRATDWIIPEDREKVKDKILSGCEEPYEATALRKDGSTFPCMLRGRKMNYNGKVARVTSLSDITEQKNAEEALLESEEIFSQFLKHSPVFVIIKDEKGRAIRLSSNFSQLLHKPLNDIIYKDMEELFPGALGKQMKSEDMQVLKDGKRLVLEEHFNGRDYTTIKFPIIHKGKTLYLAGYTIDITERLQAELKLRENEERLRMIIEHSPVGIGFSSDGITTGANPAYLKLFGYTHAEQIIGKSLLDQIAPRCRADILANIKKRAAGEPVEQSYETTGLRADGSEFPFWASLNRILFADGPLTLAFIIDLSVLKQHEELLRESEEKYRGLVQGSPDAIAIYIAGKVVFTNNASLRLMRASSIDDLIGMNVLDFVHPDSRELVKSRMLKMTVDGKELPVAEEKFIRLDGTVVDVEVRAIPVVFDKKAGVQLIVRDISERKKSEDEIAILSRAVEQSPASIIITDLAGNIEYVNAKAIETSGFSKEEIIGKNPRIINSGILPKSIYEQLWKTISTGIEWRGELANKKKNGELYWEFVSISPIKDTSGKFSHYLAIKEDITERKELEKSLIDAKMKAEAANNLKDAFIANISHEIRTPLNGILGMTSIIESIFADSTGPDEKLFFSSIDTSSRRLMSTVDKILNFSRLQVGEFPMKPARFSV
ncbi:MAG: PAS domain S-box protein, partial [Ignavibacteriales bacterium]|nr:PAS domain S-box protein [Ignavibacteriales bacterium]